MNIDKLFGTLTGSYHDGALIDALYDEGVLYLHLFKNPPFQKTEDSKSRYRIVRFDGVSELQFFDYDAYTFRPYVEGNFDKEYDCDSIECINSMDVDDEDYIVFDECIRFHAEDLILLAESEEELDFAKYCAL